MVVMVYKVRNFASDAVGYLTAKQLSEDTGDWTLFIPIEIDIPERFCPVTELGKTRKDDAITVYCDGVRYPLDEVLGADGEGKPAIVWKDARYGYLHRVRLEEV